MAFAVMLYCAPADVAIVEQPPSQLAKAYREPDTRLQFLNYGVGFSKEWWLWHRGGGISLPTPTTPGASATRDAEHRIVHHDRDERERLRSRTPPSLAAAVCGAITLDESRLDRQPLYREEVLKLAAGYLALTGERPPAGHAYTLAWPPPWPEESDEPTAHLVGPASGGAAHDHAAGATEGAPPRAHTTLRPPSEPTLP